MAFGENLHEQAAELLRPLGLRYDVERAERWRQARHRNGGGGELELVASVQKSVRAGSCNRADARRGERAKDRPASHRHTLLY